MEKLSTSVEAEEFQLPAINFEKREEIFNNFENQLEKPSQSTHTKNIVTSHQHEVNTTSHINFQQFKENEENLNVSETQNNVHSQEPALTKVNNTSNNVSNNTFTENENIEKSNVTEILPPPKKTLLPPPKKSDFTNIQSTKTSIKQNPIQNRFTPVAFNAAEITENTNNNVNQNSKSNLFFDEGNPEDDLIFGQKKKEEKRDNLSNQNIDNNNNNQESNTNENFLDYKVNSQNTASNNKNNFFDDCDMDEDTNKSKPVTGEDARAKTPNNEPTNQYLNPESGATQNIEKNNKNNLFDDDNIQNTFNIITKENKVPAQKITKVPVTNRILNVSNQSKTQSSVKKSEKSVTKVPTTRPLVNISQKNDVNFLNSRALMIVHLILLEGITSKISLILWLLLLKTRMWILRQIISMISLFKKSNNPLRNFYSYKIKINEENYTYN